MVGVRKLLEQLANILKSIGPASFLLVIAAAAFIVSWGTQDRVRMLILVAGSFGFLIVGALLYPEQRRQAGMVFLAMVGGSLLWRATRPTAEVLGPSGLPGDGGTMARPPPEVGMEPHIGVGAEPRFDLGSAPDLGAPSVCYAECRGSDSVPLPCGLVSLVLQLYPYAETNRNAEEFVVSVEEDGTAEACSARLRGRIRRLKRERECLLRCAGSEIAAPVACRVAHAGVARFVGGRVRRHGRSMVVYPEAGVTTEVCEQRIRNLPERLLGSGGP